jgi:hypothetical protein
MSKWLSRNNFKIGSISFLLLISFFEFLLWFAGYNPFERGFYQSTFLFLATLLSIAGAMAVIQAKMELGGSD